MRTLTLVLCLSVAAAVAVAQEKKEDKPAPAPSKPATTAPAPSDPLSAWNKHAYGMIQGVLLRAAEKMPEENYGFKPADTVRSYGQIVAHLADSQYYFCSVALGEPNPAPQVEKTKTAKADLVAALQASSAYCNKAFDGMTDTAGTQTVILFGREGTPKLSVLSVTLMHDMEHYGNLVTYLRMKNLVPPTSEQGPQQLPPK